MNSLLIQERGGWFGGMRSSMQSAIPSVSAASSQSSQVLTLLSINNFQG